MCHELVFRTPQPRVYTQRSFRAIGLMSMVALLLSACTSWYPMSLEPRAVPDKVRITTESERVSFRDARLVGDTAIAGLWKGGNPRSIRLVDIQHLEGGQTDVARTLGLIVVVPLALLGIAVLYVAVQLQCSPPYC